MLTVPGTNSIGAAPTGAGERPAANKIEIAAHVQQLVEHKVLADEGLGNLGAHGGDALGEFGEGQRRRGRFPGDFLPAGRMDERQPAGMQGLAGKCVCRQRPVPPTPALR